MAGTIEGGKKAAATNKKKHGKGFYAEIGAVGGANGHTGGFYANPELARAAGRLGGKRSRRGGHPAHGNTKGIREAKETLEQVKTETWVKREVMENYIDDAPKKLKVSGGKKGDGFWKMFWKRLRG